MSHRSAIHIFFPRCRLLYGKQVSFLRMVLTTRSCHETRVLLVAVVVDAKPMTWTDKNMQLMWFVCLFHETARGCVDLVILSDLLMISLKSYKVLYFNLSSIFDHPDLLFQGIHWFPKTHPNTSAVAPLRLFVSLRCCGHSQRASAWWSDHWGNACIASWVAAFNKLWQQKHTLCALLPCKWNQSSDTEICRLQSFRWWIIQFSVITTQVLCDQRFQI